METNIINSEIVNPEFVTLKTGSRPVKFYKMIQLEKSKIKDYNYIIEKIRSISSYQIPFVLYIKSNTKDELKIKNENDWKKEFEDSEINILDFIDNKNSLKIEYQYISSVKPQEEKLKSFYVNNKDKLSQEILKSVFKLTMEDENLKNKIKEDLMQNFLKNENIENGFNMKSFDTILNEIFSNTLKNFKDISQMKKYLLDDIDNNEDEILFDKEEEIVTEIPPFSEYFKNEQIELFRSKILNDTYSLMESNKK